MDALTFATNKLGEGIEFIVRNGRLRLWPAKAFQYLTDADRAFIDEHRAELKELAESKVLPETTVTWRPPDAQADPPAIPIPAPTPRECIYCRRSPCVGVNHPAFAVLHYFDPKEIARRDREATAVMMRPGAGRLPEWYR